MPTKDVSADALRPLLETATVELRKLRAQNQRLKAESSTRNEAVAIAGIGCRFPGGARGPEAFWKQLENGVDAIREIPGDRWEIERAPRLPEMRWGGFLDAVDRFDAAFFGISPREAASLDPQQRLLLEVAWEALEDAGQSIGALAGSRTGVFVGVCHLDYREQVTARADQLDVYATTGNMASTAAGRLSYTLGLEGPCITLDTACSSSLVAVHLACESLRSGECDVALAGGVNVMLSPLTMHLLAQLQALSPDGRCKTFDSRANGFVRGEGAGMVVLKRLSDAVRDGDRIWALLRGSAVNQDGRSTGLTAPNVRSQQALLRQALERARVSPDRIGYVEAHGTGTSLGDPIEVEALAAVLGAPNAEGTPCILGSVKSSIGHLEAAAGIAGLIKAALVLHHAKIPRQLHFERLNPRIPLDGTRLAIAAQDISWSAGAPHFAGVSSFGISGTNAHAVLEAAPPARPSSATGAQARIVPLSARSPEALRGACEAYRAYLEGDGSRLPLEDVAYTAGVRRDHHEHRFAAVGVSAGDLCAELDAFLARPHAPTAPREAEGGDEGATTAFVFSGQGSQWLGMGRRLLEHEPVFREMVHRCDALHAQHASWSILDELQAEPSHSRLAATEIAQPVLLAVQVALVALLEHAGIVPGVVVGHSVGEISAAWASGALDLEQAMAIVHHRGQLMQRATGSGRMAQVALSWSDAQSLVAGTSVCVAGHNGPESVVLSGEAAALAELLATLERRGIRCRDLKVDYAFHGPRMAPFQRELAERLRGLRPRPARVPMFSTVTGHRVSGPELDAAYWARNIREPVQFVSALEASLEVGCRTFVEIAPHPVLGANIHEILGRKQVTGTVVPVLRRDHDDGLVFLRALGTLYRAGLSIDFAKFRPERGRVVSLPTYSWQGERHWIERAEISESRPSAVPEDALDIATYELAWDLLPAPRGDGANGSPEGTWLVVAPNDEMFAWAQQALAPRRCVRSLPPEKGHGRVSLAGVLHLETSDDAAIAAACDVGAEATARCARVIDTLRMLEGRSWDSAPKLWVVTRGSQSVLGGNAPGLLGAPLWGLARAIAPEHGPRWGGIVDLDPSRDAGRDATALRSALAIASASKTGAGERLASRGRAIYRARIARRSRPTPAPAYAFRPDASYLVTGGLGALGSKVARWMVQSGARHLVLLGRTGLPARDAWSEVPQDSDAGRRIATVLDIERLGAHVRVLSEDVADEDALRRALEAHERACLPPIRGIVHAAGIADPQPLLEAGAHWLDAHLRPKVQGAWALHSVFANRPLDFFVAFSSISAWLDSPRLGAYAAANAFLDALACERRTRGEAALSIAWGPWAEGGMAARALPGRASAADALEPQQALTLLGRLMSDAPAHVGVVPAAWATRIDGEAEHEPVSSFVGELAAVRVDQRRKLLTELLAKQLGAILGVRPEQIPLDRPFGRLGVDSLMTMELRKAVETALGVSLSATMFWNYPTLRALTAHLLEHLELDEPAERSSPALADVQELTRMSEEEAENLLLEQLRELEPSTGALRREDS